MPIVKVGDVNIEYYVEGEGPPLLMIIGGGGQASSWGEPFLERLRPYFRIVRFSNRGTGLSDNPGGELTMRLMADDAVGLLRELGIEKAHVLGISMGGMIAQELALNHPQAVQGLLLGCTNCGPAHSLQPSQEVLALLASTPGLATEEQFRQFSRLLVTPEFGDSGKEFMGEMTAAFISTSMETIGLQMMAIQTFDSYDRLPQIQSPTLIIHGDRDVLAPPKNAEILRERIPGAAVRIVRGVAHCFFWEKPEESAGTIVEFLASVAAPA